MIHPPGTSRTHEYPDLPTLRQVLGRVHLQVILIVVLLAGLAVLAAGSFAIRTYTLHNLSLIGQSTSFTVEAAVVFDDRTAVKEAIARIVQSEDIARISVIREDDELLGEWQNPAGGPSQRLSNWASARIFPDPVTAPIVQDGRIIGEVLLWGDATQLLRFVTVGVVGALLCMLLTVIASALFARRLQKAIVDPLQTLADVAHSVRLDRTFNQRVPASSIAEITALADDFNALLAELEAWQASLRSENESLAHLAMHDSLTGLPNRGHFEERLGQAIRDARAVGDQVAILFLDNDRFKETNDRFGHAAGDAVLIEVATRIRAQLRDSDLVARVGGDEFAVLLAPHGSADTAGEVADRINASMAMPIVLPDGVQVTASLSIGIACFPDPCGDEEALLRAADAAMYEGKRSRRASYERVFPLRIKGVSRGGVDG